jgi:riboflavin kinase/FMN adenylyltransferase
MRHLRSLNNISLGKTWLTVGVFDGIHRGHQEILKNLSAGAHQVSALAVVLSFYPHPAAVLGKRTDLKYLTPPDEKATLLGALCDVDVLITHPFDHAVAALSPEIFMAELQKHLDLQKLLVGYDYALGKNRVGDAAYLTQLGLRDGYIVQQFAPLYDGVGIISSTRVRETLADGNVAAANQLLGHPYALTGNVVRGDGRGRKLNIPTANIEVSSEKAIPANGVYACYVYVDGIKHAAVTNVGIRPTFTPDKADANIEAHLLDYDADLYEQNLRLEFIERLRPEKKFNGVDELLKQIHTDIAKAKEILR